MTQICDSYSEDNWSATAQMYGDSFIGLGQAFSGNGRKLETAKFYMEKDNNPTGDSYAKIWDIMWNFGSSAVPLYGSEPLAISDVLDVEDLPITKELVTFTFTGVNQITLGATTKYCLTFEWGEGSSIDRVGIGVDHTDPTHPGNASYRSEGFPWGYESNWDFPFYVYTGDEVLQDIISNNSIIPSARL